MEDHSIKEIVLNIGLCYFIRLLFKRKNCVALKRAVEFSKSSLTVKTKRA